MNKLDLLVGNDFNNLFNLSIKHIGNFLNDITKQNIVIVPDRLSLLTEQKIFEILNIDVYFNISVMGISKFVNNIIKSNGLNFIECTQNQSKLLTLKAIQNVKENFKCFTKNYTLGLADELYSKIQQIKSSNANIDDLIDNNASEGTKRKFEDIKLIYNEYEKLRGNRLDSGATLSLFNSICNESTEIKNYNVFFIGFDSLTKQGIETLKNIIKNANNTFISIPYPNNDQPNGNIYDKTFYTAVNNMALENNYDVKNLTYIPDNTNKDHQLIINNIFSRKNQFNDCSYLNIYSATTSSEEIDFIVKSINYNIKTNNLNFKDIAICCPQDLSEQIKTKLYSANILGHTDTKTNISLLEPIKYILYKLKYALNPFDKNNLLQLVSNSFSDGEQSEKETIINLINQYTSINSILKLANLQDENILNILNSLKDFTLNTNDTIKNYLEIIKNNIINDNFYNKINNFCEFLLNNDEIQLNKTYLQLENKLNVILTEIEDILADNYISLKDFIDLLEKSFKTTEIAGIPSTINEIQIGDVKSFYGNIKLLYIVSANEGIFPPFLIDSGLISDKEINSESILAKLEPTTKIINKRNKFKALTTILSASEKCYICYHQVGSDLRPSQPSEFVTELKYLFDLKENQIALYSKYDENNVNIQKLCFNNINNKIANINHKIENSDKIKAFVRSALIKNNNLYIKPNQTQIKINYKDLFLKNNKTSISLVEKYNTCPKSAFLANGIKLQRKKTDKIETNIIGSFIHEVAELFIKNNCDTLGKLTTKDIETKVKELCKNILENQNYYSLHIESNQSILNLIINECIRFCSFLNYEQTICQFKPTYKKFGDNQEFKPIIFNINGMQYKISGIVDRIDVCEDYFRVIDYKSGGANFNHLKDGLFYGTKLQLFVYAEAINQNMDKKLFGAFYLPIKNSFSNIKEANYSYTGFFINSFNVAQKCDNNFNTDTLSSNILKCSIKIPKKNKDIEFKHNDNILTNEQLEYFRKYAIKIVTNTIKNMQDGFIDASPLDDICDFCDFRRICKDAHNKQIVRDKEYKLTNDIFMEFDYE